MSSNHYHLTLMIGSMIAVPAPRAVIDALQEVTIRNGSDTENGFELVFSLDKRSPLTTMFMLSGNVPILKIRVILVMTVNGTPNVLMDGVVSKVSFGNDSSKPTMTVQGRDLSAYMDMLDLSGLPFPAMSEDVRALLILSKYALFGIAPLVIPSIISTVPLPTEKIPCQCGTDLSYLTSMAEAVGYTFYIDTTPVPGVCTAYWGPLIKAGIPQPALNIDMDELTNVETLNFAYDAENYAIPIVYIQNSLTKAPIPVPILDDSILSPPLGLVPPLTAKITQMKDTAKLTVAEALVAGLKEAAKSKDVVTATGSLNVLRYGRVLKSRGLVGVRGAGLPFNGLYYVSNVTHKIKRGEYTQDFTLTRNALISSTPTVPI